MKRILALLLLICLAFTVIACTEDEKDPAKETDSTVNETESTTDPADDETTAGDDETTADAGWEFAGDNAETGWSGLYPMG